MDSKDIIPLSSRHRTAVFYILLGIFIVIVPLLGFYANGYRYNFNEESPSLVITGGLYVVTQVDESSIYLDEEPVDNTRFFRRATYIQGVEKGLHNVHVQGEGLQTWVKKLPVYPQIVTEASAFTIPKVPQMRLITPYHTENRQPVLFGFTATSSPFAFASSTTPIHFATSTTATTTYISNPEFALLQEKFAENERVQNKNPDNLFQFAQNYSGESEKAEIVATTTVMQNGIALLEKNGDIYAQYRGAIANIPYYFCVPKSSHASTTSLYGEHVSDAVSDIRQSTTSVMYERGVRFEQVCRTEIRIDTRGQEFGAFAFVPNMTDLVLLRLEDGIYVTEIDDRAWQNHQTLYPKGEVELLVEGGQIFIKDGDYFAELYIDIQ